MIALVFVGFAFGVVVGWALNENWGMIVKVMTPGLRETEDTDE